MKQQPDLARWFNRQIHSKEKLSAWKKEKLNAINFPWSVAKRYQMELWEGMYEQLKAYKKKHGHCDVPQKYKENQRLASWMNGQRTKKLSREQRPSLLRLDFHGLGTLRRKSGIVNSGSFNAEKEKQAAHVETRDAVVFLVVSTEKEFS